MLRMSQVHVIRKKVRKRQIFPTRGRGERMRYFSAVGSAAFRVAVSRDAGATGPNPRLRA